MWDAVMWGGVSGSAVLLGALTAMFLPIRKKMIGYIMAFGTGVLIGAAAYELLGESVQNGGLMPTSIGFVAGAITFTLFDMIISKKGAQNRKRSGQKNDSTNGIILFIGTVMDAIPESIMIGASLLEKQSVSFLLVTAIFISNFPEGLSSTSGMAKSGYSKRKILILWGVVFVISGLASLAGFLFLDGASIELVSGIAGFAGGAIIAMVASTMMPEAFEDSGPMTGFIAAAGLLVSLILDQFS
ncbi:ZIP family metal transporter [Cytobacillus sp. NCCP-133]|uniref:ZIP family metal transporter n=1 Tax=Cytobacillus sp. NCCP-133 TaxID=766848 RepID=UPI00223168E8|nr:ZIP family metal transporter [Cytobacillus sp. NCCP-133]GLB59607.1 ZIP family zinc transporter [Cytobacillus sp. NCCP-133]